MITFISADRKNKTNEPSTFIVFVGTGCRAVFQHTYKQTNIVLRYLYCSFQETRGSTELCDCDTRNSNIRQIP